jgi:hypothetical protein
MFSTRRQSLSSIFRPAPRGRKGVAPAPEVRPRLEVLEDRLPPAQIINGVNTVTSITAGAATFDLFSQTETVTVQTNAGGTGVNGQAFPPSTVKITDGGQTQTVSLNAQGQATATFKFNLSQELQNKTYGSHSISATYGGGQAIIATIPVTNDQIVLAFQSSNGTGNAPGNSSGFFFQLYLDLAIAKSLGL